MENYRITLLGSGNVAHHLCRAFVMNNIPIHQIYSRNKIKGAALAAFSKAVYVESLDDKEFSGDIFIFAVSDSSIQKILDSRKWDNKLLIHTAGSVPADIFKPYSDHYGVIYPLQTLSSFRDLDYRTMPFCIEAADSMDEKIIKKLVTAITCDVRVVDSDKRKLLHISAVFINNFTNHMFSIAKQLSNEKNIPFDIYQPLIRETVAKMLESDSYESQTGPARRNDKAVMESHINELKSHPDWQKIYTFVSQSIVNMYAKG
jgi:predicted short-subunit dehydrogenase-like oxidoreductase (DUF2520 family)